MATTRRQKRKAALKAREAKPSKGKKPRRTPVTFAQSSGRAEKKRAPLPSATEKNPKPEADLHPTNVTVATSQLWTLAALLGRDWMFSSRSDWSELYEYTGFTSDSLGHYLAALIRAKYTEKMIVPAGRTPIGGGWPRHAKTKITDAGRKYANERLARYRRKTGADPSVIAELSAALKEEELPTIVAERSRAHAEEERQREAAEGARKAAEDRLMRDLARANTEGIESEELASIIAKCRRIDANRTQDSGYEGLVGLGNYIDDLERRFAGARSELLAYLEPRTEGAAWAIVSHRLGVETTPERRDQRFTEMMNDLRTLDDVGDGAYEAAAFCHGALHTSRPVAASLEVHELLKSWEAECPWQIVQFHGNDDGLTAEWRNVHAVAILRTHGIDAALSWLEARPVSPFGIRTVMVGRDLLEFARAASAADDSWTRFCALASSILSRAEERGGVVAGVMGIVRKDQNKAHAFLRVALGSQPYSVLMELIRCKIFLTSTNAIKLQPLLGDQDTDRGIRSLWAMAGYLLLCGAEHEAQSLVGALKKKKYEDTIQGRSLAAGRDEVLALVPGLTERGQGAC